MNLDRFIVWREGAREPELNDASSNEAIDYAKAIAKKHPGGRYYVLEVVSEYQEG